MRSTPTRRSHRPPGAWDRVLGAYATKVGYNSVHEMVAAMAASEDQQLWAMVGFIPVAEPGQSPAAAERAAYARAYNGADYVKNQYDSRLSVAYSLYKEPAKRPDLSVRTAPVLLYLLGYDPHGVDGSTGADTLTALHNFQCARGQSLSTEIDNGVVASLQAALPAAAALSFAQASAGRTVYRRRRI